MTRSMMFSVGCAAALGSLVFGAPRDVAATVKNCRDSGGQVRPCVDVCVLQGGEEIYDGGGAMLCCGPEYTCPNVDPSQPGAQCRTCTDLTVVERAVPPPPVYRLGKPRAGSLAR